VRKVRIGTRLIVAFGAVLVLLVIVAALSLTAIGSQRRAAAQVRDLQVLTSQVKEVTFFAASMNGWQNAYIYDIHRLGAARALGGDSVNRKAWETERKRFEQFLPVVRTGAMTDAERQLFDQVRTELANYFQLDDKVVATFKAGTSEALWAGDQLASYDSWSSYYRILTHAQRLAESVDKRSQQAVAASASAAASAQTLIATTQARVAADASREVSTSVQAVATGSSEMGAAIQEISHNATNAAQVASEAVSAAQQASTTMANLGSSSARIGDVASLITGIAAQTNLLALNATIEAARAGEQGKGFAVVANEVKELAQQTAAATDEISRIIHAIQADSEEAVNAIRHISEVIARISDYQTTIAGAVEEQTATTSTMNVSVADAAAGSTEVAATIDSVAAAASAASADVEHSRIAATELARMARQLKDAVGQFRYAETGAER
jgi:methyl-accepting chemotaxis protein